MKKDAPVPTHLTLDTNVFYTHSWNFDAGLLATLGQFSKKKVLVLSRVVVEEAISNLDKKIDEELKKIKRGLEAYSINGLLPPNEVGIVLNRIENVETKDWAKSKIEKTIESWGAVVVEYDAKDLSSVMKLYFADQAPFDIEKGKKSQFPDALALISLDRWAKENNASFLAVSRDGDWKTYIEDNDKFQLEKHLSHALDVMKVSKSDRRSLIVQQLDKGTNYGSSDLATVIGGRLKAFLVTDPPQFNVLGDFDYSIQLTQYELRKFEYKMKDGSYDFKVVENNQSGLSFVLPLDVEIGVSGVLILHDYFSDPMNELQKDSIQLDEMLVASAEVFVKTEFRENVGHLDFQVTIQKIAIPKLNLSDLI